MTKLTRRGFIQGGLGVACSAAAAPLLTPVTVAAAPGENRLVVIILRGAMDGLGVFAPYGDPNYARLRPSIAEVPGDGLIDLDGHFGMDKRLKALASGDVLELLADDPAAVVDVPHFCAEQGHELVAQTPDEAGATLYRIRKG